MTGVLTRGSNGAYGFSQFGDRTDIGQEALIVKEGVWDQYESIIASQVEEVLDSGGEEAIVAMAALCDFYVKNVYPENRSEQQGRTVTSKGMRTFLIEAMLHGNSGAQIDGFKPRVRGLDADAAIKLLCSPGNIDKWTVVIRGSEKDSPKGDIRKFSAADIGAREFVPYQKRALREGWHLHIKELLRPTSAPTESASGTRGASGYASPPPLPLVRQITVAVGGQQTGPYPEFVVKAMVSGGQLNPDTTHVWWPNQPNWVLLRACEDLCGGLAPPMPPPMP